MDNQKDIIIKDTEFIKDIALKYGFSNSSNLIYLYKKTERISTAIFLITNYYDRDDVLKMSLRKCATELLKDVLSYTKNDTSKGPMVLKKINNNYLEIISLFEISFVAGILSQSNYQIIASEIKKMILQIEELSKINRDNYAVESSFFNVNLPTEIESKKFIYKKPENFRTDNFEHFKREQKAEKNIRGTLEKTEKGFESLDVNKGQEVRAVSFKGSKSDFMSFITKNQNNLDLNQTKRQNIKSDKGQNENKTLERRGMIIEEIKIKGEVTIKDISEKIRGVSEKTIQRELLKMVEENVLNKNGERRWSKYTLK